MGIKNINTLVKKYCSHNFVDLPLNKLKGKKIAIDTSYFMYKLKAIRTKYVVENTLFQFNNEMWNDIDNDQVVSHWLESFVNMYIAFKNAEVIPVFVLDGIPPEEKLNTQENRKQKIKNATQKQKEYKLDPDQLEKYKKTIRNNIYITPQDRIILLQLLLSLGCEVIQAKGEAEKHCAYLCNKREVFAVISADTDLFAYGCRVIITDFNFSNPFHGPIINIVVMNDILNSLKMSQEEFLFLCILCGNDFNHNVPKYGPIKCYSLIKQYGVFNSKINEPIKLSDDDDEIKNFTNVLPNDSFDPFETYKVLSSVIPEFSNLDFESSYKVFTSPSEHMDLPIVDSVSLNDFLLKYLSKEKITNLLRIITC